MNKVSIGSGNGLSPVRRQAITQTNADILSIGPLRNKLQRNSDRNTKFSFMKMHLKISSAKWCPFCPGEDEFTHWPLRDEEVILQVSLKTKALVQSTCWSCRIYISLLDARGAKTEKRCVNGMFPLGNAFVYRVPLSLLIERKRYGVDLIKRLSSKNIKCPFCSM